MKLEQGGKIDTSAMSSPSRKARVFLFCNKENQILYTFHLLQWILFQEKSDFRVSKYLWGKLYGFTGYSFLLSWSCLNITSNICLLAILNPKISWQKSKLLSSTFPRKQWLNWQISIILYICEITFICFIINSPIKVILWSLILNSLEIKCKS